MRFFPGRLILFALLVVLAPLATATAASPAELIVVYGANSGTHLTLATRGDDIVVDGHMAATQPSGCHLARSRMRAVCPLAGADGIEVDTGPSGDLVEVLSRMPFPLIAHLGAGEDKFIGNGENDTCYPEGTRHNRCVGGGGNDSCITGPKNTDCIGGPGNDYCREGAGSDGCWGGPGQDVCYMGPGKDGCHGGAGNDRLYGGPGVDQLYGGPGFDYCDGGPGIGRSHECEAGPGN
jgi:Ca2+-binding RTX toxin-like protein